MHVATKSQDWHDRRRGKITGSVAGRIMEGGEAAYNLWLELTGQKEPDDLSGVLPVQMGTALEPLNAWWFERQTGLQIISRNEFLVDVDHDWRACEVDGLVNDAIWEAKFTMGFGNEDDHAARYIPQLTHNASVWGLDRAILSVITGSAKWYMKEFEIDPFYAAQLLEREQAFYECVRTKTPPPGWAPVEAPAIPTTFREEDMSASNEWGAGAADWLANKAAASTFEKAAKSLKALVAADVSRAHGHGIEIKRSKDNKLSIRGTK